MKGLETRKPPKSRRGYHPKRFSDDVRDQIAPSLEEQIGGVRKLEDVVSMSDFLVLCCSLTGENKGMIDGEVLRLMPAESCLINVARGPLVVELPGE